MSFDVPQQRTVKSLAVHDGVLYAGTNMGQVYAYDGLFWNDVSFNESVRGGYPVESMASYGGGLYAGMRYTQYAGTVYVYNGTSWRISAGPPGFVVMSWAVYDGKLYSGGRLQSLVWLYSFNGTVWSARLRESLNATGIYALAVYGGKLYTGSDNPRSSISAYDGTSWVGSAFTEPVSSFAVYNGKLYAGTGRSGTIHAFNGTVWSLSYDTPETAIASMAVYDGKLYAGTNPNGRIYVYDGTAWSISYDAGEPSVNALAAYDGRLYAGTDYNGIIYELSPVTLQARCDNGCSYQGSCVQFGTRLTHRGTFLYCNFVSKAWERQKGDGEGCQNAYECAGNYCSGGVCANVQGEFQRTNAMLESIMSFLRSIMDFLRSLFPR